MSDYFFFIQTQFISSMPCWAAAWGCTAWKECEGPPGRALPKVEPHSVTRLWNILARYACLPSQPHFHCEMRRTLSMPVPDTIYLWFAYSAETNISYISELEWICPQRRHRMKNQENEETKDSQRLLLPWVRNVPSIKPRTRGRLASGLDRPSTKAWVKRLEKNGMLWFIPW